jgi:PAS domain S-box-containing protein
MNLMGSGEDLGRGSASPPRHSEPPASPVQDLELASLIDAPAIQSLMDDFYELAHIPMAIIDLQGRVLVGVGWQQICLQFHRVHPVTCAHCIESDLELTADVPAGEFKLYKCRNNMWDVSTPVMIGDQHVANFFSGQFFFDDELPDYELFRAQARQYGFNEADYLAALDQVPRLSRETVNRAMAFFVKLSQMISLQSYRNIQVARTLAERDGLMDSLRESEQRWATTLTSVGDGVIATDVNGNVTFLNRVAEELTGWALAEAAQKPVEEVFPIIHEASQEVLINPVRKVLETGIITGLANHTLLIRKDGTSIAIDDSGAPIRNMDNQMTGVVLVFRDITERRRAERALAETNAHLEQRVAERTAELEHSNQALAESEAKLRQALKDEQAMRSQLIQSEKYAALARMVASVAHELNNPIQTIQNCMYLLDKGLDGDSDQHKFMEMALSESKRVARLVEQLKETYRPAKSSQMEALNVTGLIENIQNILGPHLSQNHVSMQICAPPEPVLLQGIADHLKQVFLNICLNAIEAMQPKGGALTVEISCPENTPAGVQMVAIAIHNTGPCISEADLSKLFEPFFTTKSKGTGLGLFISYELVQSHGGVITVDSSADKGTTFTVWLPVS